MSQELIKVSNHIEECIQALSSDNINPAKLFNLTIQTIEYIEKEYQTFTGEQKKDLLIEAFNDLCDETKHESLTLELRMIIKNFINEDLETVIESVIQLSKGNFKINEKQQALLIRSAIQLCKCFLKKHTDNEKTERP
tara:strand:- start:335 stop:748 length:414 start_codon:yes stop_codon:yes gene_type:complete